MKLLYSIHKYDVSVFIWLANTKAISVMRKVSRYVSKTGDGQLYLLIIGLLYWMQGFDGPLLQAMLMAFSIERPLYFLLKNGLRRNRPQAALPDFRSVITPSDQFSFPSGHTSAAFLMATLLSSYLPTLMFALYTWALLVGFSRIMLGVHFPTDTLVGALMGISIATFSLGQMAL